MIERIGIIQIGFKADGSPLYVVQVIARNDAHTCSLEAWWENGGREFMRRTIHEVLSNDQLRELGLEVDTISKPVFDLSTDRGRHAWIDTLMVGDSVRISPANVPHWLPLGAGDVVEIVRLAPEFSLPGVLDNQRVRIHTPNSGDWWVYNDQIEPMEAP